MLAPKASHYQRKRPQADQRAGLEERLLLGVKPPFATGADRSLETQLSFLRNFLLVDRLGRIAAGRPIELHACSNPAVSWYNGCCNFSAVFSRGMLF